MEKSESCWMMSTSLLTGQPMSNLEEDGRLRVLEAEKQEEEQRLHRPLDVRNENRVQKLRDKERKCLKNISQRGTAYHRDSIRTFSPAVLGSILGFPPTKY